MEKIIRMTLDEANALHEKERRTPEYKAWSKRMAAMRDEDIDFSDTPELTDEQLAAAWRPGRGGARPGAGRKQSGNVPLYIRVPASWAAGYRNEAKKRKTSISDVIVAHLRQPSGVK